ncbi:hypothetical protein [Vibrio phage JSF12]|uniref:Tail fibers protein n=2 Tax=Jesfedecavirus TaxID=2560156 RepID=A0A2D0YND7_9CAUD|nr:tail fiber protein [Vibrio phage JSF10]YP_009794731.1 tail fiber protein [Vibrio phage JSF12]ASV43382.1 hypothetical protein [Vibrio phage JSF10]ASV43566.1 hypothetical protein [Vibrio phage JSF12]
MTNKITVTQALTEVKKLDKQISKLSQAGGFIGAYTNGKLPAGFSSKEQLVAEVTGNLQRIDALMARRANIKAKITESNAKTPVVVGKITMTVAEAIERKDSIQLSVDLMGVLKKELATTQKAQDDFNRRIQQDIDTKVTQILGNVKKVDANDDTYKMIKEQVEKANTFTLVDPNNLRVVIQKLEDQIEDFKLNVDVALSIVNATTFIELAE